MSSLPILRARRARAALWMALIGLLAACDGPAQGVAERVEAQAAEAPAAQDSAHVSEPAAPVLPDFTAPGWTRVESRAGTYVVHWRTPAGAIPRNADFDLEVWVLRDGAPPAELLLDVNAWMPDHGHGMLRRPRAERQPDGSFRVEGLLLHMRGHWQVFFEMFEGTLAETAECAVEL
ncbi:MAG TPA: hypothetical protein VF530_13045 [Planctomycetota bacterium]